MLGGGVERERQRERIGKEKNVRCFTFVESIETKGKDKFGHPSKNQKWHCENLWVISRA